MLRRRLGRCLTIVGRAWASSTLLVSCFVKVHRPTHGLSYISTQTEVTACTVSFFFYLCTCWAWTAELGQGCQLACPLVSWSVVAAGGGWWGKDDWWQGEEGGRDKEGGPHNSMTHRQLYLIWSGYSCGFLSRNAFKLYICSENITISSGEYLLISCRKKCEGVCMADSAQPIGFTWQIFIAFWWYS